jgi:hypothetical protein
MTLNEAETRVLHIDPQLRAAAWKLNDRTQVRLEVPVDGYDAEPWNGVTDYCLYDARGNVLAVIEAIQENGSVGVAEMRIRPTSAQRESSTATAGVVKPPYGGARQRRRRLTQAVQFHALHARHYAVRIPTEIAGCFAAAVVLDPGLSTPGHSR